MEGSATSVVNTASDRERKAPQLELEEFISYRVSILAKLIDRRSIRMLGERFNLKLSEWRVLAQLAHNSPSTVRALARKTHVDRGEVSRAAAALIRQGYVTRQTDEQDKRSALFYITPEGTRLYERVIPYRRKINLELRDVLTAAESTTFLQCLEKLSSHLTRDEQA